MIDRKALLADLQRLMKQIDLDLRERCEVPEIGAAVKAEYETAKRAERTAQSLEEWRADYITQVGAAWILSCVFARFLEDNELVDPPKLSGLGERLQRARDEYDLHVHDHPTHTVREYLLSVFDALARIPGGKEVFGEHNLVQASRGWLSGDAAKELLGFWQKLEPASGRLTHDFTDPEWDTRFLGDLYQDLSEAARKKYALLQTPEFVEEFILDRTLDTALDEFGLDAPQVTDRDGTAISGPGFRMIDPACGSGHFLLGAFPRILRRWQQKEPGTKVEALVQRTLDSIYGIDVNPYAVAIARFRLLLAALRVVGATSLAGHFDINVACGDSLLHAPLRGGQMALDYELSASDAECEHAYRSEDLPMLKRMLRGGQYHAVVANPPYITPKDRQLNERYRKRFVSCFRKYALTVPFMERIFGLAVRADENGRGAGHSGQITANSFMKREFGKRLIEEYFKTVDLTHILDTQLAHIPGHATATAIILGRSRKPAGATIRVAAGLRREAGEPNPASEGKVWQALLSQVDQPGSESLYLSVRDVDRSTFCSHPWSIFGEEAGTAIQRIESAGDQRLGDVVESIGPGAILGEDEAFTDFPNGIRVRRLPIAQRRFLVEGDQIRDWASDPDTELIFPYNESVELLFPSNAERTLWLLRTTLFARSDFNRRTYRECGRPFWEYHQIPVERNRASQRITFAFVATHNHFVIDNGQRVFKQSAPIINLPSSATDEQHLALIAVLNSSTAQFWMRQVMFCKGGGGNGRGVSAEAYERMLEYDGTKIRQFPLVSAPPTNLAKAISSLANLGSGRTLRERIARWQQLQSRQTLKEVVAATTIRSQEARCEMIRLQEDLDWKCYQLYGLTEEDLSFKASSLPIQLGQRAFEILLARKIADGEVETSWFQRHGSKPVTEIPIDWPEDYRQIVQRRIDVIESNPLIALIEQPEYKRRWNTEPWESQVERALRGWLLDQLESCFDIDGGMNEESRPIAKVPISLISIARLADIAQADKQFMEVAEVYRDRPDFDVAILVAELVEAESVPLLPVLRYKPTVMDKRAAWERTWEFQRLEDAVNSRLDRAVSVDFTEDQARQLNWSTNREIEVPPKYKSSDFQSANYWRLRGKLDVPKERWVSFPHCEGEDQSLVIAWAGYDHLQLAQAIAEYFAEVQQSGGSEDPRLVPLLASIQELVPWLKQWHNEVDPNFGYRLGDYFANFVADEARTLGKTVDDIKAWTPSQRTRSRRRRATT